MSLDTPLQTGKDAVVIEEPKRQACKVGTDRYGVTGADTNISAIHGPITDISKIFKSCFLLHYQKYVFYALPFFQRPKKSRYMSKNFPKCSNFNILLLFLINRINDDVFVPADPCSMVHLVCLFIKKHLLALLQDNCLDLVRCAFLCKLSACVRNITAFCQHLLGPIKSAVVADTDISVYL